MPEIIFINVVNTGDFQYEQELPIGIASNVAFLRSHRINVEIQRCFPEKGEHEIKNAAKSPAMLYAFQINMVNFKHIQKVLKEIKSRHPDSYSVCGGPFLITTYSEILQEEKNIDFIVLGEGEYTLLELAENIKKGSQNYSSIDGLIWRDPSGQVVKNKYRKLIQNLDHLPFPARDFLEDAKRDEHDNGLLESVRLVTSRGCAGNCTFCCVNLINKISGGKKWRGRSSESVVNELEYLQREYGVKVINFGDSSFDDPGSFGKKRSSQICQGIIDKGLTLSAKIYLRCETTKTPKDIELLNLYKKAGIDVIIPGVESGSDAELAFYNKRANVEDNFNILGILKKLDCFYVLPGFIMFGPNSTLESLKKNIDFLNKNGFADNLIQVSNVLMLIKGSALYNILKEEKRVIDGEKPWDIPKYSFIDTKVEKVSRVWQNLFANYPLTQKINKLQINTGNLISRMQNPMNHKVYETLFKEFNEMKNIYKDISMDLGSKMHKCFVDILHISDRNDSIDKMEKRLTEFLHTDYTSKKDMYSNCYNNFLQKIVQRGFSLSGIIFEHFTSTLVVSQKEQFITDTQLENRNNL